MDIIFARLAQFLNEDELHHITPFKLLGLYRGRVRVVLVSEGVEQAFLLMLPRAASQYDTAKYPSASLVVFPALSASPSAAMIDTCVAAILENAGADAFVVKSCELLLIAALRAASPELSYQRALLTFTPNAEDGAGSAGSASKSSVRITTHITPEAGALLAAHDVYSASELDTMFADGSARCLLRFDGDGDEAGRHAVAIALTFPNAPTLHEIGSLYVAPLARRVGHASVLVRAALADIARRGLAARYVVDATNAPSIELATRCGLREVMRLEHWLSA